MIKNISVLENHKLSDHFPILASIPAGKSFSDVIRNDILAPQKLIKNWRKFDHNKFKEMISGKIAQLCISNLNANDSIKSLNQVLYAAIEASCPIMKKSTYVKKNAPWLSKEAREEKRKLRWHERRMKVTGDEISKGIYRAARNAYHSKLISLKNDYYAQKITEAKSDSKALFKIVKRLSVKGDEIFELPDGIKAEEFPSKYIAFFNKKIMSTHYEVTHKRDLIPIQRRSEIELHLESVAHSRTKDKEKLQFFSEVDGPTLRKARDQLNSKTSRLDPIPTWLLKQHWNEFEPFLVSTYNKLLR